MFRAPREYVVVVTDLVEIRRLGTVKAAENVAFRRYLAARHCAMEPFQALAVSVQRGMDCTACANCCRYSVVSVGRAELQEIARHARLDSAELVRRYTDQDPEAPARRIVRSGRNGCIFLDGNLCSIYPARPSACREFPHVTRGEHSLGARMASLCRWAPLCPIVYNALEAFKHAVGYHHSDTAA